MKGAAREVLARARRPLGKQALRSVLKSDPGPYRIMIGASTTSKPGWIATDVSWRAKYYLDATRPWPVPNGSVSHVYADNMIEHLTLPQARNFLANAFEALAPGGRIRLVTPDIGALARIYLDGPAEAREAILSRSRDQGLIAEHKVDLLRVPFTEHGHHLGYLWDREALAAELRTTGFSALEWPAVMESQDQTLRDLESRSSSASRLAQLVIEARKDR